MSLATQAAQSGAFETPPLTFPLRPGASFPEWTAIASPAARDALTGILTAYGIAHRMGDYSEEEDRVRRAVIEGLAELGQAPDSDWLAGRTRLDQNRVGVLLDRLTSRDFVVRDKGTDAIIGAYPLTTRPTEHRVRLNGRVVQAMCAVDALGTGAMFGADIVIESRCRASGAPIRIVTSDLGTGFADVEPSSTLVWSGLRYEDKCAATSLCTIIAFFRSDADLEAWRRANHPDTKGYQLTLDEAMQVGRALFSPVLKPVAGSDEAAA